MMTCEDNKTFQVELTASQIKSLLAALGKSIKLGVKKNKKNNFDNLKERTEKQKDLYKYLGNYVGYEGFEPNGD